MREIQNLTLQLSRRGDQIADAFLRARNAFKEWLLKGAAPTVRVLGWRVTAVPIGEPIYVDRVFANRNVWAGVKTFVARVGNSEIKLISISPGLSERPLIRGSRREGQDDRVRVYNDLYCDGRVDYSCKVLRSDNKIYLGWVLAEVANVMRQAEAFARTAGNGDAEYGIEVEIASYNRAEAGLICPVEMYGFGSRFGNQFDMIGTLNGPVALPQVSFGKKEAAMNIILRDLLDASGCAEEWPPLVIDEWDGIDR